jgi:hypothetical protein
VHNDALGEEIMSEPSEQRPKKRRGCWYATALVLVLLATGSYYAFCAAWEAANKLSCANRGTQIAMAIANYAQFYHRYPPAYIADRNGRPLHSWRVLLLPFMERDGLYNKLRLDEPWNSPHNREVFQKTSISMFHCPSARNPTEETSYLMVVGPNTISDGPHSARVEDIKDGVSSTIMFVEIRNSGIHWAEPRDLNFETMSFRVNDPACRGVSSYHSGGAFVKLVDCSGGFIQNDFDPKLLKALITIDGGEDVSEFINR